MRWTAFSLNYSLDTLWHTIDIPSAFFLCERIPLCRIFPTIHGRHEPWFRNCLASASDGARGVQLDSDQGSKLANLPKP